MARPMSPWQHHPRLFSGADYFKYSRYLVSNGTFGWMFSCALAVRITFGWSKSIAVNTFGWFSRSAALQFRVLGGALTFDLGAWPKSDGVLGTWLLQLPLLTWREPPWHVSMPTHLVCLQQKCWCFFFRPLIALASGCTFGLLMLSWAPMKRGSPHRCYLSKSVAGTSWMYH